MQFHTILLLLFVSGGPCHPSATQTVFQGLIFLWKQRFYSLMEKLNISEKKADLWKCGV